MSYVSLPRVMRKRVMLGDDSAISVITDDDFKRRMIASQEALTANLSAFAQRETLQKWLQIAATLSIPVAAKIWKVILSRRAKTTE